MRKNNKNKIQQCILYSRFPDKSRGLGIKNANAILGALKGLHFVVKSRKHEFVTIRTDIDLSKRLLVFGRDIPGVSAGIVDGCAQMAARSRETKSALGESLWLTHINDVKDVYQARGGHGFLSFPMAALRLLRESVVPKRRS